MVEGATTARGTAAMTVLTDVAIAFNIASTIFVRLVGMSFGILPPLSASLAIGDALTNPLTFVACFSLAMLG